MFYAFNFTVADNFNQLANGLLTHLGVLMHLNNSFPHVYTFKTSNIYLSKLIRSKQIHYLIYACFVCSLPSVSFRCILKLRQIKVQVHWLVNRHVKQEVLHSYIWFTSIFFLILIAEKQFINLFINYKMTKYQVTMSNYPIGYFLKLGQWKFYLVFRPYNFSFDYFVQSCSWK